MVNAGGLARALGREPGVSVIITVGQLAGGSVELRGESSVGAAEMAVVREQDGIEANARKGRALVFPGCGHGLDRIIEGHSQRVVTRLDEGLASVPVNANRRLSGPVRSGRRGRQSRGDVIGSGIVDESRCSGGGWGWWRCCGPRCRG